MPKNHALRTKRSPYITRPGYQHLQQEMKHLWVRRRGVVEALSAAAAEGDRSENAEYIYRKKELRELDRRIRYLQKRLPELEIIDRKPTDLERVYFAARVDLEDEHEQRTTLRIMGSDETAMADENISIDSPLARQLLGKSLGDEVEVSAPAGCTTYLIVAVEY